MSTPHLLQINFGFLVKEGKQIKSLESYLVAKFAFMGLQAKQAKLFIAEKARCFAIASGVHLHILQSFEHFADEEIICKLELRSHNEEATYLIRLLSISSVRLARSSTSVIILVSTSFSFSGFLKPRT